MTDPFALCEVKDIIVRRTDGDRTYSAYCMGELATINVSGQWAIVLIPTGNLLMICGFPSASHAINAMTEMRKLANSFVVADRNNKELSTKITNIAIAHEAYFPSIKQRLAPVGQPMLNGYSEKDFQ